MKRLLITTHAASDKEQTFIAVCGWIGCWDPKYAMGWLTSIPRPCGAMDVVDGREAFKAKSGFLLHWNWVGCVNVMVLEKAVTRERKERKLA